MNFAELILLAVALGIDCLIVSFSQGLCFCKNKKRNSLALAATMGLFQGGMPLISYFLTGTVSKYLDSISSWIVFSIFMFLGIKFIFEAFQTENKDTLCTIGLKNLMLLGIATSIDALGAGVTLKFTGTNIFEAVIIIGPASFFMSVFGFYFGCKFKHFPSKHLAVFGGIILIGLAIKALF